MLAILWGWIFGYCIIHIEGRGADRFINIALQNGIAISDICWLTADLVEAKVEYRHILKLRGVAETSGCGYQIRMRRGLPVMYRYLLRKRLMLVLGCLLAAGGLYVASTFALFIEVDSKEPLALLNSKEVVAAAREHGVGVGRRFHTMDFNETERQLLLEMPLLAFVDIEREGTLIRINVAEKSTVLPQDQIHDTGAIRAAKDGLIEKIMVLYGEAAVESGTTVAAGDVLVTPMADGRASALIQARVWYDVYSECALEEEVMENRGELLREILLRRPQGASAVRVYGEVAAGEQAVLMEENCRPLYLWRNLPLPLEVVERYYQPQQQVRHTRTAAEAQKQAEEQARQMLRRAANVKTEILQEQVQVLPSTADICRVRIRWECREDIGTRK